MCLFAVRDNKDEHLNPEDKNVEDGSFDYRYVPSACGPPAPHQPRSSHHRPHRSSPPRNRSTAGPHSLLNDFSHLPPPASFPLQSSAKGNVSCLKRRQSHHDAAQGSSFPCLSLRGSFWGSGSGTQDTAVTRGR